MKYSFKRFLVQFRVFELVTAIMCILTPMVLYLLEERDSISDYAYSEHSWIYQIFLGLASFMITVGSRGNKFRFVSGIALFLTLFTPYKEYYLPHIAFTAIFLLSSCYYIVEKRRTNFNIVLAGMMITAFVFLGLGWINLFEAETIYVECLGIYYIVDVIRKS